MPERRGLPPSYEQKRFDPAELKNRLRLIASPSGDDSSLLIHQDAKIYLSRIEAAAEVSTELLPSRYAWLQVLTGSVEVNGQRMSTSDGAAIANETQLRIVALSQAEIMLFDLA